MTIWIMEHLWQSTLIILIAWLIVLTLKNNKASARFMVWQLASLKFLLPFALLQRLGQALDVKTEIVAILPTSTSEVVGQVMQPLSSQVPQAMMTAPLSTTITTTTAGPDYLLIAGTIWIVGTLALQMNWTYRWLEIKSMLKNSKPFELPDSISSPVPVRAVNACIEPGVVGIFRPVILLPSVISNEFNEEQLRAIIDHELCHVKRHDNLFAAAHMLVQALFWFNPAVWWVGNRLTEERERACDEAVIAMGNNPENYAEGILKVCKLFLKQKLPCVNGISGADLKKRVSLIVENRPLRALTAIKKTLLLGIVCLVLATPVFISGITQAAQFKRVSISEFSTEEREEFLSQPNFVGNPFLTLFTGDALDVRSNGAPTRDIIAFAYGIKPPLVVGGPNWIKEAGLYRIIAEGRVNSDPETIAAMERLKSNPQWQALMDQIYSEGMPSIHELSTESEFFKNQDLERVYELFVAVEDNPDFQVFNNKIGLEGDIPDMVRQILVDHFALEAEWETRPYLVQVVSRVEGTSAIQPTTAASRFAVSDSTFENGELTYTNVSMEDIIKIVYPPTPEMVFLNDTGLDGRYDIVLEGMDPTNFDTTYDRILHMLSQLGLETNQEIRDMEVLKVNSITKP